MAGQWHGSTRRTQLPTNWPALRRQVLARDHDRCTWRDDAPCERRATDVDHIDRHAGHDLTNLRSLCAWHHARKTAAEGNAARRRLTTRRPIEKHPGLT